MLLSNCAIGNIIRKLLPRGSEMQVIYEEVTVKVMRLDKITHEYSNEKKLQDLKNNYKPLTFTASALDED